MKKVISLVIVMLMAMSCVSACADGLTIAATNFPLYSIAKYIAGDNAQVVLGEDENAAIIFSIDDVEAPENVKVVSAVKLLDVIENETDMLTTPLNCMLIGSYLADALADLDKDNNAKYQENLLQLIAEMSELDVAFRSVLSPDTVISCEDGSMAYFAAEFNVKCGDGGIVLSTYSEPGEELEGLTYMELMQKNLEKLQEAK